MEGFCMEWNAGFWSIIPPILAIACALITKEVYFSLMLGILSGTAIYTVLQGTGIFGFLDGVVSMFGGKIAENIYIILFLCFLGILVNLIAAAGGSRAYGEWAGKKLKGKRSASLATSVLDICFFIDDYFNCLTVGTVMRPDLRMRTWHHIVSSPVFHLYSNGKGLPIHAPHL